MGVEVAAAGGKESGGLAAAEGRRLGAVVPAGLLVLAVAAGCPASAPRYGLACWCCPRWLGWVRMRPGRLVGVEVAAAGGKESGGLATAEGRHLGARGGVYVEGAARTGMCRGWTIWCPGRPRGGALAPSYRLLFAGAGRGGRVPAWRRRAGFLAGVGRMGGHPAYGRPAYGLSVGELEDVDFGAGVDFGEAECPLDRLVAGGDADDREAGD
ncbi:hypothetical protein GCM10028799_10630 [Kribbella italica]